MAESGEEVDLVADLLTQPFSNRTFPEKLDILRRGRPTPKLANLSQPGRGCVRHFQSSNYKRFSWLTASEKHCKLYCWTCLLFSTERQGAWSRTGFANLSCLTKALARHHGSAGHLQATVLLKTFGEVRVDPQLEARARREREVHNEKVKKNREILKKLVDCVAFLGKRGLSLGGHDESATNRGNYSELLALLAENDADLRFHLTTNAAFNGTSGKIQKDLTDAIARVTAEEIKSEIKRAPFVAVMADETSDESNAAQLALVLRYVTDAGVKERFVRLEDVAMRADAIAALVVRVLGEHACLEKVVSQSYHGAAVMSCGLHGVQVKVKEQAPLALFVHCYAHRLDLVLTQAASKLKECKIFFAHLRGLAAFFSRSPWRTRLLDDICRRRLPQAAPTTQWRHATRLVGAVVQKRVALKELFRHVLQHHEEYDDDSVRGAHVLDARLDDLEFCFLLHVFKGIFEDADMLFSMLQNKALDVHFCLERVKEFCDTVERERERFEQIYEAAERTCGAASAERVRTRCRLLHADILDNVLCQVRNRFEDHGKLMFLSLLDPQQFEAYRKKFPLAAFSSLTDSLGGLFDLSRLRTELTVMYAMRDFEGKGPADLLQFLLQKNLHRSLEQLHTLTCLALTVPVSRASAEPAVSALKRVQTYAENTRGQSRVSALASMAIERDFLMELKGSDRLYDRVIELFSEREKRMDFVYK